MNLLILLFAILQIFYFVYCSVGDKSKYYNDCVRQMTCEKVHQKTASENLLGFNISLWTCEEDISYHCQYETVREFQRRNLLVPQFRGKWYFTRMMGMQEPASAVFSVFNFIVVWRELKKFKEVVPSHLTNFWLWNNYCLVAMNCWIWSAVYHTRDNDLTERMDYISASVLVFMSFYVMTVRTLRLEVSARSVAWSLVCACVLLNHCAYLWFFPFDYSYNMTFNVIVGSLAVSGWLLWAAVQSKTYHPCYTRVAWYSVLMAFATLLELFDFPPLWSIFDAHALWHLTTCFIVRLFYSFIRDDTLYLQTLKYPVENEAMGYEHGRKMYNINKLDDLTRGKAR